MQTFMDNLPTLFFLLGFGCFCGVVPLLFAALTFYSARKRSRLSGALEDLLVIPAAQIQPGRGLVKLRGVITQLANPIFPQSPADYAMLRLRAEVWESGDADEAAGWRPFIDKVKTASFLLTDESGQVWVNPQGFDKHLIGDGISPGQDQLNDAIQQLEVDPMLFRSGNFRYWLWQFTLNETVTVVGSAQQYQGALWVVKTKDQPLIVSSLPPEQVRGEVAQQAQKTGVLTWILGIPGILALLAACIGLLVLVVRNFS